MILNSLKYIRDKEKDCQWTLSGPECTPVCFGNTNLIVGKNAVGKSRSLALVGDLADILSCAKDINQLRFKNWEYDVTFSDEEDGTYTYLISVKDGVILEEIVSINEVEKYNRAKKQIYSQVSQTYVEANIPKTAIVTSQHETYKDEYPYLVKLYQWGRSLRRVAFTNQFDKNHLLKKEELGILSGLQTANTIQLFNDGQAKFKDEFTESIKKDLEHLGYLAKNIVLENYGDLIGISVDEDELSAPTLQTDMSQGMFRALAFIINLNYALFSKSSVCMLIDDMGEGLDYSRSRALIKLLIHKINNSDIQIFVTTNDRYVMNAIPIQYWSILERIPKASVFYNYYNSKDVFEDFKYTGLNNFDLLATDFYRHGFETEIEEAE